MFHPEQSRSYYDERTDYLVKYLQKLIICLKFSIFNGFVETVAPSQQEEEEHLQLKNKGSKHTVNRGGAQTRGIFWAGVYTASQSHFLFCSKVQLAQMQIGKCMDNFVEDILVKWI